MVRDFGPVSQAEIALAPLTILVGRNNTGKSYVSSLLWTLLSPDRTIYGGRRVRGANFEACLPIAAAIQSGEKESLADSDWRLILAWVNEILEVNCNEIAGNILACSDQVYGEAKIKKNAFPKDFTVEYRQTSIGNSENSKVGRLSRLRLIRSQGRLRFMSIQSDDQSSTPKDKEAEQASILRVLARTLITPFASVVYIPAARTGLMIALRLLLSNAWKTLEPAGDVQRVNLTLPAQV